MLENRRTETMWEESRTKLYEIEVRLSDTFKILQSLYLIPTDVAQY
jgi:hypothetical protein